MSSMHAGLAVAAVRLPTPPGRVLRRALPVDDGWRAYRTSTKVTDATQWTCDPWLWRTTKGPTACSWPELLLYVGDVGLLPVDPDDPAEDTVGTLRTTGRNWWVKTSADLQPWVRLTDAGHQYPAHFLPNFNVRDMRRGTYDELAAHLEGTA